MTSAILATLAAGGFVTYLLVITSLLLWFVAARRGFALRRGFVGTLEDCIASLARAAPEASHAHAHARAIVPELVVIVLRTLTEPGACAHDVDRWTRHAVDRCEQHAALLRSLVAAAPLLGLLGTVNGMIETFASLHAQGGPSFTHATEQTVAGGISVALITTQMGLVIGIPGLVAARLLDRIEARRRRELLHARTILLARLGAGASR